MSATEPSNQPDQPIVQAVLEPLLADFQYWFGETQTLLKSSRANCLAASDRQTLEQELATAQQAVATAKTLLLATDGRAGVDMAVVGQWHQLVSKCWQTSRFIREHNADSPDSN
ncbi:DUF2605 family protein [Halomicronema sp. CCY15110]|uniref:DUF2605 family protein n=1 Tax=Halomicronema sp. CCY15110 TaxID=2767773 RepID=UPI00194EA7F5|nr:DUF2605 family protein [Halomicronema sp. CCY15110]